MKVETVQIPIDLPRRPTAVPKFQTSEVPVVLTNTTLPDLLERSENGELFEHFALTADTWAELKRQWLNVLAYVKQAEDYFDDIEEQVNKEKEGGS